MTTKRTTYTLALAVLLLAAGCGDTDRHLPDAAPDASHDVADGAPYDLHLWDQPVDAVVDTRSQSLEAGADCASNAECISSYCMGGKCVLRGPGETCVDSQSCLPPSCCRKNKPTDKNAYCSDPILGGCI